MASLRKTFSSLLSKDLKQALRHKSDLINPIVFFLLVVTLFPLAIGPEPNLLARISTGVIWVAALLSTMMGLERIFKSDFDDGTIEQLLLSSTPFYVYVMSKTLTHWTLTSLPLVVMSPLVALMLHMPSESIPALFITLLLGTPLLSIIGVIGAALTVGIQKSSVLLSLLVLPLYIPILIFSTSAIEAASMNLPYNAHIAIVGAMLLVALVAAPLAITGALKANIS